MDLYERNGNILYILNVLKKYSDEEHKLYATEIAEKVKEIYGVDIDSRTVRRNINLLKYKFEYDISTREENGKGYYISRDPETDFEKGEIRAIIDTFSYSNYIVCFLIINFRRTCESSLPWVIGVVQETHYNPHVPYQKHFQEYSLSQGLGAIGSHQ